jgi:hypothetical protein
MATLCGVESDPGARKKRAEETLGTERARLDIARGGRAV